MADNRSVTITLKLDNSGDNNLDTSSKTNGSSISNKEDNDSQAKAIATFAVAQLAETTTSELIAWGEYWWDLDLTLNDDYIGQREKNIALTQINRGISFASGVLSSTAQGAMVGGVAGAIVGAIVGAATQSSGIVRSNIQGRDQQNLAIQLMNAQLDFTRSRAGWSLQAASIGENL